VNPRRPAVPGAEHRALDVGGLAVPGVEHRVLDVRGLAVHVAEAGAGPPLVLLHGWPQHWYCWRLVIPRLAAHHRLVIPDLRGCGWTAAPRDGYEKARLAGDLLGLLDRLGLEAAGVVGHDWGGWVGFLAARRAPERIRGLLALGVLPPGARPPLRSLWRFAYQLPIAAPRIGPALLRAAPRLVERAILGGAARREAFPPEVLRAYAGVLRDPARARASSLLYRTFLTREAPRAAWAAQAAPPAVPTRLLGGAEDPVITPAMLAGTGAEIVPGAGHFLPEEAPDVVADRARALFAAA